MLTSVITGDIIKSQKIAEPKIWLTALKKTLSHLEPEQAYWEIYRGDSFQIEIRNISKSFEAATYIKACIKSIKGLDVRMAIGVGKKTYEGDRVTESNGDAFVFSGETLETLKKEKQNLRIKTPTLFMNDELNLYFKLALIPMDNWTVNSAHIMKLSMENPEMIQEDIAKLVGTTQNAVSKRQKRAHLDEILELNAMYKLKINRLL